VAYDFHRVLIWRARAAQMRDRAARAVSPSDVDDFEMLARYWDQRADEAERAELGDAGNAPPDSLVHQHRAHGRN
jgi:hypothetical protein